MRQIPGRTVRGQGVASEGGRREERAIPPENPQGRVWAHLGRVGGAQLSKVPDSGSAEGTGALGAVRGLRPTAPQARAGGLSGEGTARERARTRLAPKIPNRPRGPAQERLLPPMQRIRGSQPAVAPPQRPCVRVSDPAPPAPRPSALTAQARNLLCAGPGRGWLRGATWRLRRQAGSEPALGYSRLVPRTPTDLRTPTNLQTPVPAPTALAGLP